MENQSKVIVIERNKFAALVKSHRKCLQMLNILTYIYTVKEVSLTLTLQEICEVLHMTPEEVEIQRQKGYIRFTTQKGMTVYEITDLLRLENMLEMGSIYRKIDKKVMYNPQIQISAESETKRSIFREKDKTKRSKKESAQHSKSRNKSFVMTSVSAL